jgi:23S rRNA (pseudouridine1915-N3)-methyltransferase
MKISILYIGQKISEYDEMIERYTARIRKPYVLNMVRIKPSGLSRQESIDRESSEILEQLDKNSGAFVIVLDERGSGMRSEQFSQLLDKKLQESRDIIFVIGGSYGFDQRIKDRADMCMTLSMMTLPHEIVRLLLVEQIYRAIDIQLDGNYHHD